MASTQPNMARKDYDYYIAKYGASKAQATPNPPPPVRSPHARGVMPMVPVMEQVPMRLPPRPPTSPGKVSASQDEDEDKIDNDEALLDLAQLEELHHEAERMKALGNKHMAAQEYTRAYNAYSAALQLSPVGPSSHVFLSNRSAALLSLKRYSAAATDAKRALALAPTFGKAHARLGQALYFLKDYAGAVAAYEDAIHYEPDNSITKTYLEKAKSKADRQKDKQTRAARGEEVSVLTENSNAQVTLVNSVATDPDAQAAVVKTLGFRGQSNAMAKVVGATLSQAASLDTLNTEDDPDFEEALRIQERANRYLANKNYKYAIEEYTAALFLVPDDYNLSPDLHLGRAHALNGSRRHESAKIDATLALRIKPSPEAFSTLAKSLFYMKDYQGAIENFGRCKDMLPEGESLSMFDRAYLQKSEAALQEALQDDDIGVSQMSANNTSPPIPKLKPPRFVPREEALSRTPNIPSMPKSWPQQSPRDSKTLKCGEEREVLFLSEALGIKLNRGPDGIVRVIEVSPEIPGSPIAREGKLYVGDVIREVAGVDLRRPITNIMWGDTVAFIKMAPRPIVLVVAEELSPPVTIPQQRRTAAAHALSPDSAQEHFPSDSAESCSVIYTATSRAATANTAFSYPVVVDPYHHSLFIMTTHVEEIDKVESTPYAKVSTPDFECSEGCAEESRKKSENTQETTPFSQIETESTGKNEEVIFNETEVPPEVVVVEGADRVDEAFSPMAKSSQHAEGAISQSEATHVSLHDEKLGKEILFVRGGNPNYSAWDNLRWMSYSGTRQIAHVGAVSRFVPGRRTFFWSGDEYLERVMVVYTEPHLILILRQPRDAKEVLEILDLPNGSSENADVHAGSYLVVESVIDPKTCKLKLSSLTTVTVVLLADVAVDDHRRRSCFELVTPMENIVLSAVRLRQGAERPLSSFHDSGAYLETTSIEHVLQKCICDAHQSEQGVLDLSWKHQVILGTLHSYVVLGNQGALHSALLCAKSTCSDPQSEFVDPRIIDAKDESGRTPLHYACASRLSSAVSALVKAGANVDVRLEPHNMSPCHLAALNLDSQSLEIILSVSRRPGVFDDLGRTPIYLAIMDGHSIGSSKDPEALECCLSVLESHGAEIEPPMGFPHPVGALARSWSHGDLEVTLRHLAFTYPLVVPDLNDKRKVGISISAFFQYPVHSCLIALRSALADNQGVALKASTEKEICRTLEILFSCGFEPNERLEGLIAIFDGMDDLLAHVGFAPTQILGSAALDAMQQREKLGDATYLTTMKIISGVMYTLVSHGGRLGLDPPPSSRSKESDSSSISHESSKKNFTRHDPSLLKLQDNKRLIDLLGAARLKSAEKSWSDVTIVPTTSGSLSFHTDKFPIENSEAPGGSDVKSCSICWTMFGTITNRKHRCRISRRHVCNECSSRCISDGKEEHRVSDGQFLLGRHHLLESNTRKKVMERKPPSATSMHTGLAKLEAQELGNRESLFGNVMGNMAKAVFGEEDHTQANSLEGLSHSLNQTRNLLHERGDKLNTLADKSDRLVTASKDFATMAKELNRQTQGGFFW